MVKQFNSILIEKSATIIDALKQLDKTAEKILFVVENGRKLVGSLTDGDVRRWILKDKSLNTEVGKACYKDTYYVEIDYNPEKIKEEIFKRKIVYVPVVTKEKEIVEFLIWDKLFDGRIVRKIKDKIDAEVVIMAGGRGTRLDPFTRILPKPLLPIGDKSIIEFIIDKFIDFKVGQFYLTVNHKAKIIKSYFEELSPKYKLIYLYEDKPLGTVGSLKQLQGKLNKDIILTNCDIIIEADYADLLKHHNEQKNVITVVASLKHYNIPYGICEIENGGTLVNIAEKPEYDFWVNTGMYVLNPIVLKHIPLNKHFHMTNLIDKIKDTHKIGIYPISENSWIDTGEWAEYKKAINRLTINEF